MSDQTLFDPRERDACGTGFVADILGRRSHDILSDALTALCNLEHRGAVSQDGRTSDGAGVQTQIPFDLVLEQMGKTPARDDLSVGMFFFASREVDEQKAFVESLLAQTALTMVGWREVPFDRGVLGADALEWCPSPWQLVAARPRGMTDLVFDQTLYRLSRQITRTAQWRGMSIPSWSRRTVVYKGLVVPSLLTELYPDLADPRFETSIALFHQRYSTNSRSAWRLAQPFRFLAHNGEINTLRANVNRMEARQHGIAAASPWLGGETRVVENGGSDSSALDNALEFLVAAGRDLPESVAMLVPEAYEARVQEDSWADFARYHSALMEPWDGPAALVYSDGVVAGAALDRNGLRPIRYWRTADDRVVVGSEAGVVPCEAAIVEKGRLGPGETLLVDTARGGFFHDAEVKAELASRQDWSAWAERQVSAVGTVDEVDVPEASDDDLTTLQHVFGYGREHVDRILGPMGLAGKIPVGSMGDDTPLAVLSEQPQRLYAFFMQRFAQVTNPSIDPLRERAMMSLTTRISVDGHLLDETPRARLIEFDSPIVGSGHLKWLESNMACARLDATFDAEQGLAGLGEAVERLCEEAHSAVAAGTRVIILSDRGVGSERIPVPMLLATGAVNNHLMRNKLGAELAIVCDVGDVIEDHDVACLIGFGASLVHPWLAYESVAGLARRAEEGGTTEVQAARNYRAAVEKGLLKIMAKLGIADVNGYRGGQMFEALGVDSDLVERCFTGTPSRIGGVDLQDIASSLFAFHSEAYGESKRLQDLGIYRFRRKGEYHAFHPGVFKWLHKAVRESDAEAYAKYARAVDTRPSTSIRDLLRLQKADTPTPLDEVESAESIAQRFCTQAMSFGSLSREAHEVMAVAMNRLGGKSNSGEGGEEPIRLQPYAEDAPDRSLGQWHPHKGDVGTSAIKQVASGRFGVTPAYLVSAKQLEIKMAQGSKPGEGGQIPGFKVTEEIAKTRGSQPGQTLISPPPHHDIYSIEDLAQLIYDLKRVNERATVAVKLVSVFGVGTIATGVAKGYADAIQVSGHDGGTGASPLSSIKHAGLPWELGLGEVQQRLVENGLRGRVRLRVDGGLKTGRDVVIAAMLGAEEFGFGTAALVSAGCVMARQCHSNTCPVGVATQREDLRARFPGKPEHIIAFMMFVAEHVRHILSDIGAKTLDDVIGRVEMLQVREDLEGPSTRVDLSRLLWVSGDDDLRQAQPRNNRPEDVLPLDEKIVQKCREQWEPQQQSWPIDNRERSVGARLAGEIALRGERLEEGFFDLRFEGVSGQSFGVFCNEGMRLTLIGEAQDYVGKGIAGGEIILRPPAEGTGRGWVIMGNTCAYGATGGTLLAAGEAGERLAVRNSGATIVVEGCGDHACEYMTGGTVVVLGETGINFAAGMTGGQAYVYDEHRTFTAHVNHAAVECSKVSADEAGKLRKLVERHFEATGSSLAQSLLSDWTTQVERFVVVSPNATTRGARPKQAS